MNKGKIHLTGKRVLLLFPHLVTAGGALNYTLKLAKELEREGASVAILTLRADRDGIDCPPEIELIIIGGPLTSSLSYWLLFFYWQSRINRAIACWQPDVLVPHVFPANWWGWLYKRRRPEAKLAWICHEPSAFIHSSAVIESLRPWWKSTVARGLSPVLAIVDRYLARGCDRIIANSRFTASEIKRIYGVKTDGVACPGIEFSVLACEHWQKEREIITVARLNRFKRIDFLLEVFRGLLRFHPELTYHIVGTGEDRISLQDTARKLGVESRVVFHGSLDDSALKSLYRRSRLFLHGSIGEPFGMAPLEAIACGTPVVAHRSGGLQEFIDENCGILIASLQVNDWVTEISEYLDLVTENENISERTRECARNFDWRLTLQPAIKTIASLCSESVPGSPISSGR
jgi:glycosyltransferase involved in cell wall biosynthesis